MTPEERLSLVEAAVDVVRAASRRLELACLVDVLEALEAIGLTSGEGNPCGPTREQVLAVLPALLAGCPDVEAFNGLRGELLYHAPELLSRTYARILDSKGSPVALMAGEIRANSREYPRPVPVELFEAPPFDLAPEDISQALQAMATLPDYRDITFTTTPSKAVFLFSTLFLDRSYATFLAQQTEQQAMNP